MWQKGCCASALILILTAKKVMKVYFGYKCATKLGGLGMSVSKLLDRRFKVAKSV